MPVLFVTVGLVAIAGAGCSKAAEPPVKLPGRALEVAVSPDNYGTLWLTTLGDAYRSVDGGHSWKPIAGSLSGGAIAFGEDHAYQYSSASARVGNLSGLKLVPYPSPPVELIAVTSPYYLTQRFYGLDAAGRLWLSVNTGRAWSRVRAQGLPAGGVAIAARRQDPILPDTIYVAEGRLGLWKSLDYGATFHRGRGRRLGDRRRDHGAQQQAGADRGLAGAAASRPTTPRASGGC